MAHDQKLDFADDSQWVTVPGIPVLDEHEMMDPTTGKSVRVTAKELQEIADNNNKRVLETNNPAPLCIGHTSDEVGAPEPPVVGYAVNYRVAPFMNTGRQAIYVDYKVRRDKANVIKDFPRRSVELWWRRKEFDPIALLGGTTPERDLGDLGAPGGLAGVLKFARGQVDRYARAADQIVYHQRRVGSDTVIRYEMPPEDSDMAGSHCNPGMAPRKMSADDGKSADMKDMPAGDDKAAADPEVQKVFATKQWAAMNEKLDQVVEVISELAQQMQGGGGGMPGGKPPKGGSGDPHADSMEAATGHAPIRFEADDDDADDEVPDRYSAYAANGYVPQVERKRMSRPRPGGTAPHYPGYDPYRYPSAPARYARPAAPADDMAALPAEIASNPVVIRMQRELAATKAQAQRTHQDIVLRDCREKVARFAREHRIDFAPSDKALDPRTAEEVMEAEAQVLALMDPAGQAAHETRIVTLYKRKHDPVANQAAVTRYARTDQGPVAADPPMDPSDVSRMVTAHEMARAQGKQLSFAEITNMMAARGGV